MKFHANPSVDPKVFTERQPHENDEIIRLSFVLRE
jgi:hypothetical protein